MVLWSSPIDSVLAGADQIELVLSKAAGSDQINASYSLFDYDLVDPLLQTASILNAGALYQPETGPGGSPLTPDRSLRSRPVHVHRPHHRAGARQPGPARHRSGGRGAGAQTRTEPFDSVRQQVTRSVWPKPFE